MDKNDQLKEIKTADFRKNIPGYENFICYCPECDEKNIFNRISDLRDPYFIDSKLVVCQNQNCRKSFYINSDIVSIPFESLIRDSYELIEEKRYTATIITLCLACESFFNHAVKARLILEPYQDKDFQINLETINYLFELLYDITKKLTYQSMKLIFIDLYFFDKKFSSVEEIEIYIKSLKTLKGKKDLTIKNLEAEPNMIKKSNFQQLYDLSINTLRNTVAHKQAYRPSKEEANEALENVSSMVMSFKANYNIMNIEWYLNRS